MLLHVRNDFSYWDSASQSESMAYSLGFIRIFHFTSDSLLWNQEIIKNKERKESVSCFELNYQKI